MQYRYSENENFEDLACGRVLIHRAGFPNFPIRLAQEIFCRCRAYLPGSEGLTLYDPCCGGAYLLTVLGFLNQGTLARIFGSDISPDAVALAQENLALLTPEGLERRRQTLERLYSTYQKESHLDALRSAERLSARLKPSAPIETCAFRQDLLAPGALEGRELRADIVFFDVPYGNLVEWQGGAPAPEQLLDALLPVLSAQSVVAVCSDKAQKFASPRFARLEKQPVGKRMFQIFRPI